MQEGWQSQLQALFGFAHNPLLMQGIGYFTRYRGESRIIVCFEGNNSVPAIGLKLQRFWKGMKAVNKH